MNCTDCQNQFSDFIDDEISLKMARSVKSHLASCPACSAEWQLFQQTVTTLHSIPVQKVPADFIIGINEKLDQQPLGKLRRWFSFMSHHKLTTGSALATLMVGVISAAVLQLSPVDSDYIMTKDSSMGSSTLQNLALEKDHVNYYPGIPYLQQKTPTQTVPVEKQARVQFTPVNHGATRSGHKSLLDSRGSPSMSLPALSQLGTASPDLVVTVHSKSTAYQHALIRQLTSQTSWKTQITGNSLLVTLPCNELSNFQHLFGPVNPHINTSELSRLSNSNSSRLLTVAVAFH